jgi:hypothetical protein
MNYGEIVSRAFSITLQHRVLWWLGLGLVLTGHGGACSPPISGFGGRQGGRETTPEFTAELPPWLIDLVRTLRAEGIVALLITLLVLALIVAVVLQLVGAVCQGALIYLVDAVERGAPLSFSAGLEAGMRSMWRLFFIALLVFSPFLLTVLILLGGALASFIAAITGPQELEAPRVLALLALLCLGIPAVCLVIVVAYLLSVLAILAQRAVVLENLGLWQSIRRGWTLLRARFWELVLLSLIWIAIGFLVGIVVALPVALVALPFAMVTGMQEPGMGVIALLLVVALGLVIYAMFISTLNAVFSSALWTLAYRRIAGWQPEIAGAPTPVV